MLSSSPSNNNTTTNTNSTTDLMSSSSPSKNTTLTVPSSRSAFAPFSRSNNTPITNQASLTTSTANNEDHQNNNQGNNPTTTENPFTKYYSSQSALKLMTIGLALHKDFNKKKTLTEPSIGVNNDGLDNADGNLIIYAGSILGERYYVKEMLGQGTFGQVVKCEDLTSKQIVAVKVVKNKPSYLRQARIEINILDELAKYGSNGSHHIITKLGEFNHQNHLCIVIEILGMNLFELIKQNRFKGLSLNVLSVFLSQLLDALCILSEANIIHCDLKPENILLTDLSHPKDLVRLIDFGSACHENEMGPFYIQSRFYRAPEVIFGMRYNKSIDMWSLGCICAELFLGLPLLPGVSQYNQVGRMIEMFGIPPPYMIEYGKHSVKYFKIIPPNRMNPNDTDFPKHQDGTPSMYELKSERQFLTENPKEVSMEWKRYFNYTKLPDLVRHYGDISKIDEKEMRTRDSFIDFLNGLLQLDPYKRWTPDQAKLHPFVTGKDFVEPFIPPHTPQYLAHMRTLQQLHSSERVTPQQVQQQQQVYNPQYYGSTPNQSFLPFGLSPVAGGNFMGGSSLLGMSPVANNTYQKPSSFVGSFDQQIPLGSSPYLKPGIPISGSHNNQMPVGSYGSSVGSLYGSSFGSNANLTFGVSPGVHNYPPQFYNGMYQASPSGSNLGVSPGAYSSSLLGTTPSAAGTPSGSRGRSSTLSGKNPYHHHHNNSNVDNLSFNMAEMTLEDGNNNTNPNITFSKERPRSFSSAKYHNNNGTPSSSWNSNGGGRMMNTSGGQPNKNNPYHQNNNGSAGNVNTNNNKSNKGYKNSPTGKHSRKGRSTDIEGESSDDNWNPFFPSDLDDDSASSTGFNPYYSKKNNSGSGLSDYQGSPSGKGANFGSPPKQIPTNTNKEYSPKNSYDEGSFSKPRHGSIPQNTPNNSGKKNFGNQQKKRTNNY